MYHFFITTKNGQIVKANDVKDALERGEPDYYGFCSASSVWATGKTVLSTLLQWLPPSRAGQDLSHVMEEFGRSHFDECEDDFFLYPITKQLYLYESHLHRYTPYVLREDGRAEFDQLGFANWLFKLNQEYSNGDSFFNDFQKIVPLMVLAWHQNQPAPSELERYRIRRKSNGQIVESYK